MCKLMLEEGHVLAVAPGKIRDHIDIEYSFLIFIKVVSEKLFLVIIIII